MEARLDEGLSLRTLAERIETLERENARLRSEVAALLRGPGVSQRAGNPAAVAGSAEQISRRRLLRGAGAAAVGLVVAGALTQRDIREAKAEAPFFHTTDTASRGAIEGENRSFSGYGVWGNSQGFGVKGNGRVYGMVAHGGVGGILAEGTGDFAVGVIGQTASSRGTVGVRGTGFIGVEGRSDGTTSSGVLGQNDNAVGVSGKGKIGVTGQSSSAGFVAVYGQHTGPGGIGVRGDANDGGYGGRFSGGKAQLRLVPGNTAGAPDSGSHLRGEIYMGSGGALFVCTADGTPGRWRRVETSAL